MGNISESFRNKDFYVIVNKQTLTLLTENGEDADINSLGLAEKFDSLARCEDVLYNEIDEPEDFAVYKVKQVVYTDFELVKRKGE